MHGMQGFFGGLFWGLTAGAAALAVLSLTRPPPAGNRPPEAPLAEAPAAATAATVAVAEPDLPALAADTGPVMQPVAFPGSPPVLTAQDGAPGADRMPPDPPGTGPVPGPLAGAPEALNRTPEGPGQDSSATLAYVRPTALLPPPPEAAAVVAPAPGDVSRGAALPTEDTQPAPAAPESATGDDAPVALAGDARPESGDAAVAESGGAPAGDVTAALAPEGPAVPDSVTPVAPDPVAAPPEESPGGTEEAPAPAAPPLTAAAQQETAAGEGGAAPGPQAAMPEPEPPAAPMPADQDVALLPADPPPRASDASESPQPMAEAPAMTPPDAPAAANAAGPAEAERPAAAVPAGPAEPVLPDDPVPAQEAVPLAPGGAEAEPPTAPPGEDMIADLPQIGEATDTARDTSEGEGRIADLPQVGDPGEAAPEDAVEPSGTAMAEATDLPGRDGEAVMPGARGDRPRVNRPGATQDAPEAAEATGSALARFAAPFDETTGLPVMSVVLLDDGSVPDAAVRIAALPVPVTVVIDPARPDAVTAMDAYRAAGVEVMALVRLPAGARPVDVAVTYEAVFARLPEAIGVIDTGEGGLQAGATLREQALGQLAAEGRGALVKAGGLNSAARAAAEAGVPVAVFDPRLDQGGADESALRRVLDQAAFRARQAADAGEGGTVLLGAMLPQTLDAITLWQAERDTAEIEVAPVSAILLGR